VSLKPNFPETYAGINMVFQRDDGSLLFYSRGWSWWMVFLRENVSKLF